MTNTGTSTIGGDIGSSPTHSEVGFGLCPGTPCVSLTGTNHDAADPNDAVTQQAKTDLITAYDDAFGRTGGTAISAPLGGGTTIVPGVYTSAVNIFVGGDLTLDAGGDPDAVFIFQAKTGTLTTASGTSGGVPNTRVLLAGGAQACNVFWQVGTSATIATSTQFVGTILALQSISLNTGATLDAGRALARNGAVTLDSNVLRSAPCATPTATTPTAVATTPVPTEATAPTAKRPTGNARLSGAGQRVRGPFTLSVTGSDIAKIVVRVDGKPVATVRGKRGRTRYGVRIDPRRQSPRVHHVTVTVTYTPKSGKPPTRLRTTYRRPPAPPTPKFTG